MLVIGLGAAFLIVGLVLMAAQALWRGPMSMAKRARGAGATLEPPTRRGDGIFGLSSNWPGILLMVIGGIMLLSGAAFMP